MKTGNKIIAIEAKQTGATDGYGHPAETWARVCQCYAGIYFGTGSEQRAAMQEGASLPATFEVLSDSVTRTIAPLTHRIEYPEDTYWDITSAAEIGLNEGVRIIATKAA